MQELEQETFTLGSEMELCGICPHEQGSKEWLDWRKTGIGGSDVAAVVGEAGWSSMLKLWAIKSGAVPDESLDNEDMEWRHRMEPMILQKMLDKHTECELVTRSPCFKRTDYPFMLASLDAITADQFGNINTEIKTAASEKDWLTEDGEETVPSYYMCQALWQMMVTGIKRTRFAVLVSGFNKRYFEREIEYNQQAAEMLFKAAVMFWNGVLSNTPPPPDTNNPEGDSWAIKHIFPTVNEEQVAVISNEFHQNLSRRLRLKEQIEHLQNEVDTIENGIKMLCGSAKMVRTEDGRKICSKSIIKKVSIKAEDLKKANEPLYIRLKNESVYPKWTFNT